LVATATGGAREGLGGRGSPRAVAGLVAGEEVERAGGVLDRARQHAIDGQEALGDLGREGDPVALRLEADEPTAGGGDAGRAAAVVAVRDRDHARGDRRRGAARRAAARARRIPRVARGAEALGVGPRQDPPLRERRGPDDHEAGVPEPPHHVVVVRCLPVAEQLGAEGQALAGDRAVVLDRDRHAREGPLVAGRNRVGGGQRVVVEDVDERVELGIEGIDAVERGLDELARGELAGAHQLRELGRRAKEEVGHGAGD
jgi:hypothetical protein